MVMLLVIVVVMLAWADMPWTGTLRRWIKDDAKE